MNTTSRPRRHSRTNKLIFIFGIALLVIASNVRPIREWLEQNGFLPAASQNGTASQTIPDQTAELDALDSEFNAKEITAAREYCERINAITRIAESDARAAIASAAKELSDPLEIVRLIAAFATDPVTKKNNAQAIITARTKAFSEVMNTLGAQAGSAGQSFQVTLQNLNADYAASLLRISVNHLPGTGGQLPANQAPVANIKKGILFESGLLVLSVGMDAWQWKTIGSAIENLSKYLAKLLEPLIKRAAGSAVISQMDSPAVPVLDIITVAGFGWTLWDVYHFQGDVRNHVERSLNQSLQAGLIAVKSNATATVNQLLAAAAEARKQARAEVVQSLAQHQPFAKK